MKIIDPTLPPCDLGPLHFAPVDDGLLDHGVFSISSRGEVIGELTAGSQAASPITLDHRETPVTEPGAYWHLELADAAGRIQEAHVLCVTADPGSTSLELTGELAVWATLTVTWANEARPAQYG
jgi:hypothetical protein